MMANEAEIADKFWKALESDMTLMLGLSGVEEDHSQPMTAQLERDQRGSIWFFTAKDTDLVRAMGQQHRAFAAFAAKDHELFASLRGELFLDNDRATLDRLWNRFVAAWFEGGKDDPNLQLIRFEPEQGQIWLNEHQTVAGIKILLGRDPKKDYKDKVAQVRLN
jgi:general stress protein 26